MHGSERVACPQTLYFPFNVRRARVLKYKPQGFIDRQRKGVEVGEDESFSRYTLVLGRSPHSRSRRCFRKEK